MKKLLFLLLIFCLSSNAFSQGMTVHGKVFNARNKVPVEGALVEISQTEQKVYTDSLGNFKINAELEQGKLLVSDKYFDPKEIILRGEYWKRSIKIGLIDSIWKQNNSGPNNVKILTSENEYQQCLIKRKDHYIVDEAYKVLYVLTKQGDTIKFNRDYPGRISSTGVIGLPQAHLYYDEKIDSIIFNRQSNIQSIWKDGIHYEFITRDSLGYFCHLSDTINIPFAEIDQLQIKYHSKGKTIAAVFGIAGPVTIGLLALVIVSICKSIEESSSYI